MAEPLMMEEIVEEILLHLPPDDPASLLRAAAVCKQWCRVICAPGFRRRFAQRHLSAPMLGFLAYTIRKDERGRYCSVTRFVPTTTFRPPRTEHRYRRAVDARHGRVLLTDAPELNVLEVWDPVTDELRQLSPPAGPPPINWNAAVVCAAHGACGHQDCRRGPFLVVLLDGDAANIPLISLNDPVVLTTTGDSRLGFARVEGTQLCLWLVETHPEGGVVLSHVRSIELETLLLIDGFPIEYCCLNFAHGAGVIYVRTLRAWFSIDLKSNQVKEEECVVGRNIAAIPYMSLYTPGVLQTR
ncbi:hypothetical protein U9M48_011475 [Paspalum notatum var. saurae]|uniref:F-box domain-containing protein n=1 Tax=Paspalum notatum var. saurae TaxID=547442 RepID=A0AAQ3SVU8_PASNO